MSIFTRKLSTNLPLWAVISVTIFVVLGFVNLNPKSKGSFPYWDLWAIFLRGEYICPTSDFIGPLAIFGMIIGVPSVVLGWIIHAWIFFGWALLKNSRARV
jgi:hypothetical protein